MLVNFISLSPNQLDYTRDDVIVWKRGRYVVNLEHNQITIKSQARVYGFVFERCAIRRFNNAIFSFNSQTKDKNIIVFSTCSEAARIFKKIKPRTNLTENFNYVFYQYLTFIRENVRMLPGVLPILKKFIKFTKDAEEKRRLVAAFPGLLN